MNFEEIYRGYVIKEKNSDYFVGPDQDRYRVILRCQAARFTKNEAIEYIKNGIFCKSTMFCKDGKFVIEDAT